jgi:1,5-anhydro-D-fructose reductase (1,5-anhydro-D-mannitol-forming)
MRIASLSFWHLHGADYARDALENPDFDLVAAWDDNEERGRASADNFGIPFVKRLDDILEDPTIEGVVVCSSTAQHESLVTRCIRAGKHVFMEKVLSSTLGGAERIAAAAREAGVTLTVSLWRSDCGYAGQIADLIASGILGEITSARIRDGHPFALPADGHPNGLLPEQFYNPAEALGGVLIDLCHPLYLMIRIMGLPERATSMFGHVTRRATEDNAAVLMTFPNGCIGITETTSVSRVTPFSIEVHGTEGSLLYTEPGIGAFVDQNSDEADASPDDHPRLRLRSTKAVKSGWQEITVHDDAPTALNRWRRLAASGRGDDANLDLAVALSSLVEAAYASTVSGNAVDLKSGINQWQ